MRKQNQNLRKRPIANTTIREKTHGQGHSALLKELPRELLVRPESDYKQISNMSMDIRY